MQTYMRVCPICAKENMREKGRSKTYVPGWIFWFKGEEYITDDTTCSTHHNQKLVKKSMTCEEFNILNKVSTDPSFMESMNDLKEKDIIEYTAKLSQFKSQVNQQTQQQESNKPKCPTCGSTKLSKVSTISKAGSVALWGLFSQKVKKTWHCNNCGYEW